VRRKRGFERKLRQKGTGEILGPNDSRQTGKKNTTERGKPNKNTKRRGPIELHVVFPKIPIPIRVLGLNGIDEKTTTWLKQKKNRSKQRQRFKDQNGIKTNWPAA